MGYTLAMEKYDVGIVGGGIVGLATALTLKQRHPDLDLCVVETEVALHPINRSQFRCLAFWDLLQARFKQS